MSDRSTKENIYPSPAIHDGIRTPSSVTRPLGANRSIMNFSNRRRDSMLPLPSFSKKDSSLSSKSRRESLLPFPKPVTFSKQIHSAESVTPITQRRLTQTCNRVSSDKLANSNMLSNPEEYVDILETYVKHDMMLDKQDSLNLNTQIISLSNQIRESTFEQYETNRERTKIISLIEELRLKCEEMDKKIVIKENEINNEINKHQLAMNLKKKEIQERYEKEEKELEESIKGMINDLKEENCEVVLKSEKITLLKASIQEFINRVSERRIMNDSKLNDFRNELTSTNSDLVQVKKTEIQELTNKSRELQYQKAKLVVDNRSIKEVIEGKKRKFDGLNEKMNLLHTYQGTLDDSIKLLKTRKMSLMDQLSDKEYELKEIENGRLEQHRENRQLALSKLQAEELKRRKVEYQVIDLKKSPRIVIRSDKVINNTYEVFKLKNDCFNSFRFLIEEGLRNKYSLIRLEFHGELTSSDIILESLNNSFKLLQELSTTELYSNYTYSLDIDHSHSSVKIRGINKISKSSFENLIQFIDMTQATVLDASSKTDNGDRDGKRTIKQFVISSDNVDSLVADLLAAK